MALWCNKRQIKNLSISFLQSSNSFSVLYHYTIVCDISDHVSSKEI